MPNAALNREKNRSSTHISPPHQSDFTNDVICFHVITCSTSSAKTLLSVLRGHVVKVGSLKIQTLSCDGSCQIKRVFLEVEQKNLEGGFVYSFRIFVD
ncbi:hypothetical protein V6N12_029421 [Hibiscus sabdariffa]|uniref:Uncharacterized protein n=1 Tax=Hibiscus sabdariffa TaxID=183260 RepID=A0ABR2CW21_9ROSI